MKRKICLLTMALSLTVCLAACGGPTSEVNPTPTAPSVAPTDSPTPSAPVPSDNIVGRGTDGAWAGNDMDGMLDDAYDVTRGAVDGARDTTRGVIDGMDKAADDARNAARNAADNIRGMTGTGQPYPDPITGANNTLW